jgi:hypothetical protein
VTSWNDNDLRAIAETKDVFVSPFHEDPFRNSFWVLISASATAARGTLRTASKRCRMPSRAPRPEEPAVQAKINNHLS